MNTDFAEKRKAEIQKRSATRIVHFRFLAFRFPLFQFASVVDFPH